MAQEQHIRLHPLCMPPRLPLQFTLWAWLTTQIYPDAMWWLGALVTMAWYGFFQTLMNSTLVNIFENYKEKK